MLNYYSKVVKNLINYKKYCQRLKKIELDNEDLRVGNMGIDYSSNSSKKNNISDRTGEIATEIMDKMSEEYKQLYNIVRSIEIAYHGLNDLEQFVVNQKYMSGRKRADADIYTNPKFEHGSTKYYKIKNQAVKKIAEILGYI